MMQSGTAVNADDATGLIAPHFLLGLAVADGVKGPADMFLGEGLDQHLAEERFQMMRDAGGIDRVCGIGFRGEFGGGEIVVEQGGSG